MCYLKIYKLYSILQNPRKNLDDSKMILRISHLLVKYERDE